MFIGTKFQIFEGGESKVRRLVKIKSDKYVLKEYGSKENIIVTKKELTNNYVRLTPDAYLNIIITKEPNYNGSEVNDVYFTINKNMDILMGVSRPALILRQNIFSKFKNINGGLFGDIYIGECATYINSTNEELAELLTYETISNQKDIAIYIDDSEDDILSLIPNKFKKDVENTLCLIKSSMPEMCKGATETIKQLWDENDFIGNFKSIFNITQIDFPIFLGDESLDSNGDIKLNTKQKQRLEDILRRYISNIKVIKYDKDIDISKIVNVQHVVVSDSTNQIYLIAYTVDGYYADNADDAQVLESFGLLH